MAKKALAAALAAALALPAAARAQEADRGEGYGEQEYGEQGRPEGGYAPEGQDGYDVSVDLATPGTAVTIDTFRPALAPYGTWETSPTYGYVWRPTAATGWRPYYYGEWAWTDEGWMWVSQEPWAWATYHYGRWGYDPVLGSVWVPGYQWAPAWVSWRFGPDVIGWAPLAPGFSVFATSYAVGFTWWTFVPCASFVGYPVYRVAYAPAYVARYYYATRPAPPRAVWQGTRTPAWGGPPHRFVEQRIGRAIAPARLVSAREPGTRASPGVIPVYRPEGARSAHPGWGSARSPGWGPPGRVPAPGARPGSTPRDNRPGWASPPGRGPAPAPRGGPQGAFTPAPRGGGPQGGFTPAPRSGGAQRGFTPAPRSGGPRGGFTPAPRGGAQGALAPAPRGGGRQGGLAPAPRGGPAPAARGGESRGGGSHDGGRGSSHRR